MSRASTGLVVIGLWLAIVGYGLAYSGMVQLGGGKCSIVDAFKGACQPATTTAATRGTTLLASQQNLQAQQSGAISSVPIPQVA